ncbi:STN domain-containing protein [Variovorax sp. GB1P17]|uniref:STN domain-containing protein n=1 Tax=Variovorax sp. GB1P17 TaxID=3443740 RepID=UPI003F449F22
MPPAAEQALDFDIPAVALGDALKRYAAVTRQPALFRSEILLDLTSSAVRGLYAPDIALRLLLEGTGLVAEKVRTDSGVTLALKPADAASTVSRAAGIGSLAGYPSLVQAQVWEALCDDARTRPGAYRSLLRFEVDAMGQIRRPRLLGATGDASRDAAMLEILQGVHLAHAPPPDLPQPLTLLILPTDSRGGPRCRSAAS